VIPLFVAYLISGDAEEYLYSLPYRFFENDVLQFAGLFFLVMALFIYLKLSFGSMLVIALVMSVAGMFLSYTDTGNSMVNTLLGNIIATMDGSPDDYTSCFPLLNWFIIPLVGYIFGYYLLRVKDKKKFYSILTLPCALFSIIYLVVEINLEVGMYKEGEAAYYFISTPDVILCTILSVAMLGVYYFLSLILPAAVLGAATEMSRVLTPFFCIHWVFVIIAAYVFTELGWISWDASVPTLLWISLVIFIISYAIAELWYRKIRPAVSKKQASPQQKSKR